MPKLTQALGYFLIVLGVAAYFLTGMESVTALIPAFFGLVFAGLGYLATTNEAMRKHAMHAALLLAILGLAGSFGGLVQLLGALGGGEVERPAAAIAQSLMAISCLSFLIMGIKSFIAARKGETA
ncbi:MAG: hypothetical protein WDZ29_01115 [Balneolaceae bacterium]